MPRPSIPAFLALATVAVIGSAGCKTIYTDTHRPVRNYFKPEKEAAPKPTDLLPPPTPTQPSPESAPLAPSQAPGLDPAPAGGAAPATTAPAIPGL